jgi:multidrug resistance efflux pump
MNSMTLAFSRSLRALDSDRSFGAPLFWFTVLAFGSGLMLWFVQARVQVLVSADNARIEVSQSGHRVQAAISGEVTANHQSLDRSVRRGELLLELDSSVQRVELEQRLAELRTGQLERAALAREIDALQLVVNNQQEATRRHLDEAELRRDQAQALSQFRDSESQRNLALGELGALSTAAARKSVSDAEQQRREAQLSAAAIERVRADRDVLAAERSEQLSALRKQLAALQGRLATLEGAIASCRREIERRSIRAPIDGQLGDVAAFTVGSFVREGDTLSTIVPAGSLRMIAEFSAAQAVGRIRPGQSARMRVAGFPWTAFGTLRAVVAHVAAEVREGRVRVELAVDRRSVPQIVLRHGLSGSVEIELERVSPATLVWRAAGRRAAPTPGAKP